jgi:hypothetical protein
VESLIEEDGTARAKKEITTCETVASPTPLSFPSWKGLCSGVGFQDKAMRTALQEAQGVCLEKVW